MRRSKGRQFFVLAALIWALIAGFAPASLAPALLSPAWAADRQLPNSGSAGPITGPAYMDAVADEVTALWNAAPLTLTSVGGTANAITANVAPPLTGSLVDGMAFYLTPVASNTGATTLKIGAATALSVVDSAGTALASGALQSGQTYHLLYRGTANKFHILGPSQATGPPSDFQLFTANGTWTKPLWASTNTLVLVECWGGGGGGSVSTTGGGGGGGAYNARWFRASELAATEAVSIGNGGTVGTAGSTSSLGSKLSAFGGGGAGSVSTTTGGGGGGGGPDSQGLSNANTTGGAGGGFSNGIGGVNGSPSTKGQNAVGGGGGGAGVIGTGTQGGDGYFGGGGGGGGGSSTGGGGGNSHFGGGGGAGNGNVNGGFSTFGGNGGAATVAGTAPGGGGGQNAVGARGECRVTTR